MKIILEFLKFIKVKDSIKPQLGRWNIDTCSVITNRKVDLSNEDHCGPCGQYKVKEVIEPQLNLNLKNITYEKINKSNIDLSNEDHCGPCGQYKVKEVIEPQLNLNLKNITYEKINKSNIV